jgi:fibronectin-binding autotransporter adhesin
LTVSGLSTNTGSTTITAGTLKLGGKDKWSDDTAITIASGATFDLANFNETVGSIAGEGNISFGSASFTVGGDNSSTTYSGVMSGSGRLTKTGNGVLLVSGNNTYSGVTTISAGTLRLGAANRLSNSSAVDVGSGATFDLNDFDETVSYISSGDSDSIIALGTATITTSGDASSTYAGLITGQGGLTKGGSGTLTIQGSLAYVGTTAVSNGTLKLALGGQLSDSTAVVVSFSRRSGNRSDRSGCSDAHNW